MTAAFALNALFAGLLIYGAAALLLRLIRGRAAYLLALAAFLMALGVPLWMTRSESTPVAGASYRPGISVDAQTALFTRVWIVGAVLLLLRELAGHVRLARIRGRPLTHEEKIKLRWPLDDDRIEFGNVLPMTLASRVLLPPDLLDGMSSEVATAVVRHERAHLRWRDPVVGAVVRLVLALFWIALPLWLLERLIRREREAAADAEALRDSDMADAADYAEALVRFARTASAGAAAGFSSELEGRVRRLFRGPVSRFGRIASLAAAVGTVTAVAFVPVARFSRPGAGQASPLRVTARTDVSSDPETGAAKFPSRLQTPRRRIEPRIALETLPTGSRLPDLATPVGEPIPPPAPARSIEAALVADSAETTVAESPTVQYHADRDVHVDVRRHVIRIRD